MGPKKLFEIPVFPGLGLVVEILPGVMGSLVVEKPIIPFEGVDIGVKLWSCPEPANTIKIVPVW